MPTSDELRAMADRQEVIEGLERDALEAKAAFTNDRNNEDKAAAYRSAVDALAEARADHRSQPLAAVDVQPGSVTILPNTTPGSGSPSGSKVSTEDQEG